MKARTPLLVDVRRRDKSLDEQWTLSGVGISRVLYTRIHWPGVA